jgi:hypothetical protein
MAKTSKIYGLAAALLLPFALSSCDSNASHKTLGNSQDTTSVNRGGGPAIQDTATISKNRRDSAKMPAKDSMKKGNADPSGHIKNQ